MLQGITQFIQNYPKLFVLIIIDIVNIVVFIRELLKIEERPDKRKMIILISHAIILILSIILLIVLISLRESII